MISPRVPPFTCDILLPASPPAPLGTALRTHDIIRIDPRQVTGGGEPMPDWVSGTLLRCSYAVVRRGFALDHLIPIGIRGATRSRRWAGFCSLTAVREVLRPPDLRTRTIAAARAAAIPAFRVLEQVRERWRNLSIPWGPGGSAAFELATGLPIATPRSDLDLIFYVRTPISHQLAHRLLIQASGLPAVTDLRVETPSSGVSLREYVAFLDGRSANVLLRTAAGAMLGTDPWAGTLHLESPDPRYPQFHDEHWLPLSRRGVADCQPKSGSGSRDGNGLNMD
jgi:phosphoribosyl-dephospho-CoA transferase